MTSSIQRLAISHFSTCNFSVFADLQEKASQVFTSLKEALNPPEPKDVPARSIIDLQGIWDSPGELVEGTIWGAWWAAGVYFLAGSIKELYNVVTVENSSNDKFQKIVLAVKSVFVDLLSIASSTMYAARWADGAKVIALGRYLPLVKNFCYGTSLFISGIELGFDIPKAWVEAKGLLYEQSPFLSNQHAKRLGCVLMKIVSNVSMVAWALLGITSLAGVAVSSVLMTTLLAVGCIFGLAAIYYKTQIDPVMELSHG